MTIGQEQVAREHDFAAVWQQIEALLVAKCEPMVYAELLPLAEAMFTAIDRVREQAIDRTFGEAFRLGRAQGRTEAARDLSRTLAIKDDVIQTLSRGYAEAQQSRLSDVASVSALATALETGDWGETH